VAIGAASLIAVAGKVAAENAVVDLTLEASENLTEWQPLPVTGDMLTDSGTIMVPGDKQAEFYRMRVATIVLPPPPPPEGFALIPAGPFLMGYDAGSTNERPVHTVDVSAFYIARTEVTK